MNRSDNLSVSQDTVDASAFNYFRPISILKNLFNALTGGPVEIRLDDFREIVKSVKAIDFFGKADLQLAERMLQIARSFRAGCAHQDAESANGFAYLSPGIEIETFALVREASRRSIGLDPYDVQLIAGMAMARGCIAELPTGEGKTLAAVFTACLRALSGRGVHILTFNDYLARRDASWMGDGNAQGQEHRIFSDGDDGPRAAFHILAAHGSSFPPQEDGMTSEYQSLPAVYWNRREAARSCL